MSVRRLYLFRLRTPEDVKRKQVAKITATGATGVATGDHLHFGISVNAVYVNPCNYVAL